MASGRVSPAVFLATLLLCSLASLPDAALSTEAQPGPRGWLDQPLVNWNTPGATLPRAPIAGAERDEALKTCDLELRRSTAAERAVADAGWISFLSFDRVLAQEGVEIVNGLAGADGMCRPWRYNIFVFVDGGFAGTLSPRLMNAREDGASGAVRIVDSNTIIAEFERYTGKDALCCPSSRVTVRYRIDRSGRRAVVTPVDVRVTRG